MKINFLAILIMIFCSNLIHAVECGEYKIKGHVREKEKGILSIIVNEGTKSELVLSTFKEAEFKLIAYENKPVTLIGVINQFDGVTKGHLESMSSIELRIPNPMLGSKDTGIELVKKSECKK